MNRKIFRPLTDFWLRMRRLQPYHLALIFAIIVFFISAAFTVFRWSAVVSDRLSGPRTVPVTGSGNQVPPPPYLTESATAVPPSPITPDTPSQLAAASCQQPQGWVPYLISAADSSYQLSVTYAIPLAQLLEANCLATNALFLPGQVIYVPNLRPAATETLPTPIATKAPPVQAALPSGENVSRPPSGSDQPGSSQVQSPTATPIPPTDISQPPATPKPFIKIPEIPTLRPELPPFLQHTPKSKPTREPDLRAKPTKPEKTHPVKPKS